VVAELDLPGLFIQLVHGEVDDPAEAELVGRNETELVADLAARRASELLRRRLLVADEEHRVAIAQTGQRLQAVEPRRIDELGDRALRGAFGEDDVAEARRAFAACPIVELIEEAARLRRHTGHGERAHHRASLDRAGEDLEARAAEYLAHFVD